MSIRGTSAFDITAHMEEVALSIAATCISIPSPTNHRWGLWCVALAILKVARAIFGPVAQFIAVSTKVLSDFESAPSRGRAGNCPVTQNTTFIASVALGAITVLPRGSRDIFTCTPASPLSRVTGSSVGDAFVAISWSRF